MTSSPGIGTPRGRRDFYLPIPRFFAESGFSLDLPFVGLSATRARWATRRDFVILRLEHRFQLGQLRGFRRGQVGRLADVVAEIVEREGGQLSFFEQSLVLLGDVVAAGQRSCPAWRGSSSRRRALPPSARWRRG